MRARRRFTESGQVWRETVVRSTRCGKQGYTRRKLAATAAAVQARLSGEPLVAYHCRRGCHLWHIGHQPTRGRRPARGAA